MLPMCYIPYDFDGLGAAAGTFKWGIMKSADQSTLNGDVTLFSPDNPPVDGAAWALRSRTGRLRPTCSLRGLLAPLTCTGPQR